METAMLDQLYCNCNLMFDLLYHQKARW